MPKTIIKEIGIVILLIIAIILSMGIAFYDYIPKNKSVPVKSATYEFPEEIKEVLQENIQEEQNIVKTYYIDETDLSAYESKKDYNKGKPNPFADSSTKTNIETKNNNTSSNNNNVASTENKEVYYNKSGKF